MCIPRAIAPFARQQVSEFVELSHRLRVPSLADHLTIGAGEWVSTAMVRATAFVICNGIYPTTTSWEQMTDLLMLWLAEPRKMQEGAEDWSPERPFVATDGQILFDVSASSEYAARPEVRLIHVNDRPELWPALEGAGSNESKRDSGLRGADRHGGGAKQGAATQTREATNPWSTQDARSPEVLEADGLRGVAHSGALVWGSAATISSGRPFLDINAIVSYAREKSFQYIYQGDPNNASQAMNVATGLEIVVMLDPSLRSGAWIDVDPATSKPTAVLAIDIKALKSERDNFPWRLSSVRDIAGQGEREKAWHDNGARTEIEERIWADSLPESSIQFAIDLSPLGAVKAARTLDILDELYEDLVSWRQAVVTGDSSIVPRTLRERFAASLLDEQLRLQVTQMSLSSPLHLRPRRCGRSWGGGSRGLEGC